MGTGKIGLDSYSKGMSYFCCKYFHFSIFYLLFISMGRKSLNKSYEQVLEENRIRSKEYYKLHKEEIKKKAMDRYNRLKNSNNNEN